jgi:hypothetical protein
MFIINSFVRSLYYLLRTDINSVLASMYEGRATLPVKTVKNIYSFFNVVFVRPPSSDSYDEGYEAEDKSSINEADGLNYKGDDSEKEVGSYSNGNKVGDSKNKSQDLVDGPENTNNQTPYEGSSNTPDLGEQISEEGYEADVTDNESIDDDTSGSRSTESETSEGSERPGPPNNTPENSEAGSDDEANEGGFWNEL